MKKFAYSALIVGVAGCLSVPNGPQPMCQTNADCNHAAGEVCDEGVCWGNPPPGPFAAALGAPADVTNVVATELPRLVIPDHGWVGDLVLDTPVVISGRLEAFCAAPTNCDHSTVGATIKVHRDSLFYGGPGFTKVFTSKASVAAGKTDSFTLAIPRSHDGDPIYKITIEPDGRGAMPPTNGSTAPAELVPPLYLETTAPDSVANLTLTLGGALPAINGYLIDSAGLPLQNYRVVAMGRWNPNDPLVEVSTVAYSIDGHFTITLASHIAGSVELVAKPWDPVVVAPTLRLGGVEAAASQRTLAEPMGLGKRLAVTIPVKGVSGNGEVVPVAGAKVIVTGSYKPQLSGGARAELVVETTTDASGNANLTLLDGAAIASTYKLRVIPPASSPLGVVYDQPLTIGQVTIPPVRLPARLALRGMIVDTAGKPMGKVSVTARPSLRFQWSLDAGPQQFLASIPTAPAITPDTGDFVVWVDPFVADIWGHYDLNFEPPQTANAAAWTLPDIEIDRVAGLTTKSLDTITVPDAAFIHGRITDVLGNAIEKAELRVFQIVTNTTLCAQVAHPGDCVIPAQLQGHGTSNALGIVKLTLPRR